LGNFGRENSGFEPKFWEIFSFFEFDKNWYKNIGRMGDQKSRKIAYVLCERSLSSKIERSMGAPNHVFQPLIFCPIFFHYISVIQIKYQFYWAKKILSSWRKSHFNIITFLWGFNSRSLINNHLIMIAICGIKLIFIKKFEGLIFVFFHQAKSFMRRH
jgi:hypothetical protein